MVSVDSPKFGFVTNELIALARNRRPDENSWQTVKQSILKAATLLRKEAGQVSPPIALKSMEELRCIREKLAFDSEESLGAILVPVRGGFVVRVGKNQRATRRRFSIAHEIGHTFFYNLEYDPPSKILPREGSRWLGEKKEEDICNAFASELLMPRELVEQDVANLSQINLKATIDLARKYLVSPAVAARRLLLDLSKFETAILIFVEKKNKTNSTDNEIWWHYGQRVRSYLRNDEEAIFKLLLTAINDAPSVKCLEDTAKFCLGMASLEWYQPTPESRLMILLTFRRDDRSAASHRVHLM